MLVYFLYLALFTTTAVLLRDKDWLWYHGALMLCMLIINLVMLEGREVASKRVFKRSRISPEIVF